MALLYEIDGGVGHFGPYYSPPGLDGACVVFELDALGDELGGVDIDN